MGPLLAHLVGDYVLQNHAMATRKTSSWPWALLHAAFYTLPFLLLTQDWRALAIIGGTHAVIDRYRLARYWVNFWGVGVEGWVIGAIMRARGFVRLQAPPPAVPYIAGYPPPAAEEPPPPVWHRRGQWHRNKHAIVLDPGPPTGRVKMGGKTRSIRREDIPCIPDATPFLGVWLLILVDNTMHLCINAATLATFG